VSEFVKQLTDTIESQKAELAELKQALAALTDKLNPPKPAPVSPHGFGGAPVIDAKDRGRDIEDHAAYMERIQRQAIAHREQEAGYMQKRREGLSDGQWRDDCGLIRDREGKIVPSGRALDQQIAKAAAHEKAAKAADLAWRKSVEIPILHGADEADDE
jgi:hypothetical protein